MKLVIAVLVGLLLALQYRLWFADGGWIDVHRLQQQVERQADEIERLRERNAALEAEVLDLKEGLDAIEARARGELGMIREGETFFQVVEPPEDASEHVRDEGQ